MRSPEASRTTCLSPHRRRSDYLLGAGYALLDITHAHTVAIEGLPLLHGDPFDRMLVAQALTVPLRLLTHDVRVARYSDTVILV